MRIKSSFVLLGVLLMCCRTENRENKLKPALNLVGTWQLINGTVIEKGDTTVTDYTRNVSFIKIINDTHFAFLQHDLKERKDSAVFVAGGGTYSLSDSLYTEHLQYCSDRQWEGNDFACAITIQHDTLTQRGIEKVERAGVNRINIEKYKKLRK